MNCLAGVPCLKSNIQMSEISIHRVTKKKTSTVTKVPHTPTQRLVTEQVPYIEKKKKKKLEAHERLYRSTGLIFPVTAKRSFNLCLRNIPVKFGKSPVNGF